MGSSDRALVIDDFVEYINVVYKKALLLQNIVFEYFYKALPLKSVTLLCGFYMGSGYVRLIYTESPLTRHSGICKSAHYDKPCSIREKCGAYKNAKDKI